MAYNYYWSTTRIPLDHVTSTSSGAGYLCWVCSDIKMHAAYTPIRSLW